MSRQSGELPPGWALTELGALSERRGGGTPSRSVKRYFQGNIPWVTVADLPPIGAAPPTILASREAITDEAIAASSAKPIPKDSVVFATRVSVGKVAIAGCTLATNQDFRSLLPGSAHEPSYIAWFLSHIAQFNLPANQGTTIKGITTSKFDGIQVPLPPRAEQRRIVAKIEALQERSRRAREALLEVGPLLEQFRQSVLAAAFRGDLTAGWRADHPNIEPASELLRRIRPERRRRWEQAELAKCEAQGQKPPKNWQDKYEEPEPVDDSELPELPEAWCWTTLGELALIDSGEAFKKKDYGTSGLRLLQIANIGFGKTLWQQRNYLPEHFAKSHGFLLLDNTDIVMALNRPILDGRLKVTRIIDDDLPAILYQRVGRLRTAVSGLVDYLFAFMRSPLMLQQVERNLQGTDQPYINTSDIPDIIVPLAPLAEQTAILTFVSRSLDVEGTIEEQRSEVLTGLDYLDQAILAKAFRGELVPQDGSDEPASVLLERIRAQRTQQAEPIKGNKKISKSQRGSNTGKKSSRLMPQQLTLTEVLTTKD